MADELTLRCRKRFASGFVIDADFRIPFDAARLTVLFGPSGAGKTGLLRLIAGLDQPDEGVIAFRGRNWYEGAQRFSLPPQQRRASFLFQDYALFPHLTVEENVEFGARNREQAQKLIRGFGLAEFRGRMPREISGGQQQRAALARALAAEPALLLLDEPLSALDAATRLRLRQELRHMLAESGVPSIVVTHDRAEAIALGDWIAVMIDGSIAQYGPIHEVYRRPANARVAESVGVENILPAVVVSRDGGLLTVQAGPIQLQCVDTGESGRVFACIRAEDVAISREVSPVSSARNRLAAAVRAVILEGPLARIEMDCGVPLVSVVTARSASEMVLKPGDAVCAVVKATSVQLTPAGTE
jgi:molybdate transport system ATP-binding protein